jgi:RNA polymerase sigma-70 factor (ECF subfamily)
MNCESDMLAACLKGDAEAWDRLFDLHYGAVGRFVTQLSPTFSPEDVEEVCQETFLTVVRSLGSFGGRSQLQTWIFRIAANKARDFVERQRAQKRGGGEAPLSLSAENPETGLRLDPAGTGPGPDEVLANRERWGTLHAALEEIGEPCRETIELRYFGDLSYEEIAAALELNPKTVSSRLSKCLDRLGEIMSGKMRRENSAPFSV